MLFSSLEFILLFLPVVLIIYYILPRIIRNAWLLASSLVFYAWGEPRFVLVMIASIVMNWLFALILEIKSVRSNQFVGKTVLTIAVLANLGLIGVYKYANFLTSIIRDTFPSLQGMVPQTSILLPIGISFFTFQALSYVVDVYRGIPAQRNPINIALYIAMFPQLIAGPIVRYDTIAKQLVSRKESLTLFSSGVNRFLVGFCKKMLLANIFAITADRYFGMSDVSTCGAWLGAICYAFQIFFDFSAYSDMAIGLGRMFGFEFLENFNYPYISRTVTEFWRRWHMSLGSWFRDYLYFPLGGSRVSSKRRLVLNLMVVWFATGVWHGANWTFILWGILYGFLIIVEKLLNLPEKIDKNRFYGAFGWALTMFFVILGWVLFRSETVASAFKYVNAMFGATPLGFIDDCTYFEFNEVSLLLVAGSIASIPWCNTVKIWVQGRPLLLGVLQIFSYIILVGLFFVAVSHLIMNAHNPFIYFNF